MTNKLTGSILTPAGWIRGTVHFDDAIRHVEGEATEHPTAPYILPGFVDLHVHGGGGADMMEGGISIRQAAALHLRHGTTSMLATSVTAPIDQIERFLDAVNSLSADEPYRHARILGAHLEGPFLNPEKLGAQPPFAIPADAALLAAWADRAPIKVVTFAPERDPDGTLLDLMLARGIKAQIGHSLCDHAMAAACIQRGAGLTHLFNAMSPMSHRGNGAAGAALSHADFAEIIPDLLHVEEGAILAARRAIPNLYGVTDSTAGAGMPDGTYRLGSYEAIKTGNAIRLPSGELAGSVLTMDVALHNLCKIGLPLAEAAERLSTLPANWIGASEIGRIADGCHADLTVFDSQLSLTSVWLAGRQVQG